MSSRPNQFSLHTAMFESRFWPCDCHRSHGWNTLHNCNFETGAFQVRESIKVDVGTEYAGLQPLAPI